MRIVRGTLAALGVLGAALAQVGGLASPAAAQVTPRPQLIVTVSDNPDPAPSASPVVYAVTVKNDGVTKARNVVVTIPIPAGTAFVKCTMLAPEATASTPCAPGLAAGVVTATFPFIRAHLEARVNVTLTTPLVNADGTCVGQPGQCKITVSADANGDDVTDDRNQAVTTVLPAGSLSVDFLPSGRKGVIACGLTLSPEIFGADTTIRLSGGLGCAGEPFGLKITASGKTIDLNEFKIVGVAALGNVGILVSNASDVTIVGGSTNGTSGIESFDWCVKDEGKSLRLTITNLRCFRARSAGIDIRSKKGTVTGVLIDRAVGTTTTTAEPPGGVGIRTRSDQALIKDSIVRRPGAIGIWLAGTDANANGRVAKIEGSTPNSSSTMRIEDSAGIGLLLDGGPHSVKNVYFDSGNLYDRDNGDDPIEGNNAVVVGATGVNNLIDNVVVKQFGGNAFVVDGAGTIIQNSSVDGIGLDGFVVTGTGSTLKGNDVQHARRGFVVAATAVDTDLNTNTTEEVDGDGFVVDGDTAVLTSNSAAVSVQGNGGRGFVIGGGSGLIETNTAEKNDGDGFIVTGNGHTFKGNKSKENGLTGFTISGTGNQINTNAAEQNGGLEWVVGPDNFDGGSNKMKPFSADSPFTFTSTGGHSSN